MRKSFLGGVLVLSVVMAQAQESKPIDSTPRKAGAAAGLIKPVPPQEELEAKFKAMLTKATLTGRWAPITDGALGPEKEDKYEIQGVAKISGDSWVVHAKVKFNDREFIAPLPVTVKWAGDTPVLIVDNLTMPGGNRSYSARVIFYDDTYSGTWSGGDHGGMLYGVISNEKGVKNAESK